MGVKIVEFEQKLLGTVEIFGHDWARTPLLQSSLRHQLHKPGENSSYIDIQKLFAFTGMRASTVVTEPIKFSWSNRQTTGWNSFFSFCPWVGSSALPQNKSEPIHSKAVTDPSTCHACPRAPLCAGVARCSPNPPLLTALHPQSILASPSLQENTIFLTCIFRLVHLYKSTYFP